MKKIFLLIIIPIFLLLSASFVPVQAANLSNAFDQNSLSAASGNSFNTTTDLYQITGMIIQVLLSLLGVIFIVLLIYGGITWMTAEGDEAKVEKAQGIIRTAIIGLVIVLAAYAISFFVINALTASTLK